MNLEEAYAWTAVAVDSCGGSGNLDVARAHTLLRKHLEAVYGAPTVPFVATPALAGVQYGNPAGEPPPKWAKDVAVRAKAGAIKAAGSVAAAGSKLRARLVAARAILGDATGTGKAKAKAGLAAIARALGALAEKARAKVAAGAAAGAAAVEKVIWYQSIGVGLALLAGVVLLKSIFGGSRRKG